MRTTAAQCGRLMKTDRSIPLYRPGVILRDGDVISIEHDANQPPNMAKEKAIERANEIIMKKF